MVRCFIHKPVSSLLSWVGPAEWSECPVNVSACSEKLMLHETSLMHSFTGKTCPEPLLCHSYCAQGGSESLLKQTATWPLEPSSQLGSDFVSSFATALSNCRKHPAASFSSESPSLDVFNIWLVPHLLPTLGSLLIMLACLLSRVLNPFPCRFFSARFHSLMTPSPCFWLSAPISSLL